GTHGGSLAAVAVPCLVLLVPILDMTMVSATRILTGRSVAEGGRDHSSHRLVSLGLSERSAVLLLCGLSAAAGTGAILVRRLSSGSGALSFTLLVIAFGIFGVYLSRMTFDAAAAGERKARRSIATEILYEFAFKRRLLEVTLDLVLMMCAYALAYGLRFDFQLPDVFYRSLILSLPLVVAASFPCFFAVGVYRGMWQFTGPREIGRFFVGAVVATLVSLAAVVSIYRFDGFSRSVFPLYGLLLFVFVALSRLSFRLLSGLIVSLRPEPEGAVRVAIYGAGQLGEILAGELYRANGHAPMKPVGFIDDNESKRGHGIHGVPVLGGVHELEKLYSRTKFERLLVSSRKISEGNLWRAKEFCRARGIRVQRYDWVCEDVE
ncbi:MAG TPA: hypothetical protein VNI01_11475, partial [Elusimicrobiota bacterium]|nr:hypothetical protein [Elusimicrobiota bacterium]